MFLISAGRLSHCLLPLYLAALVPISDSTIKVCKSSYLLAGCLLLLQGVYQISLMYRSYLCNTQQNTGFHVHSELHTACLSQALCLQVV